MYIPTKGRACGTDNDKLQALVYRNFFTKVQEPVRVGGAAEGSADAGYSMDELEEKVRGALRGTSNRSAPGPDSINYRLIKMVLDTRLGGAIVKERKNPTGVAVTKVVFISKPGKDHRAAKGWRPINLINCIGKLAENVVADELQEAALFHGGYQGKVSIGSHGESPNEIPEGIGKRGTGGVGHGRCKRRI